MRLLSCPVYHTNPVTFNWNFGESESATELGRNTAALQKYFISSVTFGEHLAKILESLLKARDKCSVDNWDGYGAKPINSDSFNHAVSFALSLPSSISNPEVYVDPDGDITFEWYEGKRQVFSVTVGNKNELAYAGLFGANKTYGVEQIYEEVPDIILENINKLYSGVS